MVLLVIIFSLISFPVISFAGALFNVKPEVSAGWRVDSNYYRDDTIEREVYTYLVQPGIELGIETAKGRLLLDYTLDIYSYDDRDSLPSGHQSTDKNDYIGHTGNLEARYRPFGSLLLGLDNSLHKTRDSAQSDALSNAVDREKYVINRLTPMILYDLGGKFSVELRYRNTETDYNRTASEDSTEHREMFNLVYHFTQKTSLDLEYQHWKRDYDLTTSDYTSDQLKLVFRKQFKCFSFEVGGGYHDRDFDDSALKDSDVFAYRIAILGQNPPAPETPRSHISLAVESNFNDQGVGETYYKARRFTLTAGRRFREKLLVDITGYYQDSDYESSSRKDNTYDISGRVGYKFTDRLTFSITAGHEKRDSNRTGYDYDNDYFMAKFEFSYDPGRE